jgi:hypothetical protein
VSDSSDAYDAIVIGGGFYGATIASFLRQNKKIPRVLVVEKESSLLSRASYRNQARVHNGYHYPRSFTTAYRSSKNFSRFAHDWEQCIKRDFAKYYAISRRNSKVTALQFERFCNQIDAPVEPAEESIKDLFNPALIEEVFKVQEFAFDAKYLAQWAYQELAICGVDVWTNHSALEVFQALEGSLGLTLLEKGASLKKIYARKVFNCTYSGINQINRLGSSQMAQLKHEIAELALVRVPEPLENIGLTVMDGPFFSLMPFPPKGMHTLSHVRYTPHWHWVDKQGNDPYRVLEKYSQESRVDRMLRDSARYFPKIIDCKYAESLFEVKTVLVKNEVDDGRPIFFQEDPVLHGYYSVLGGKIDNIYDILERINEELDL